MPAASVGDQRLEQFPRSASAVIATSGSVTRPHTHTQNVAEPNVAASAPSAGRRHGRGQIGVVDLLVRLQPAAMPPSATAIHAHDLGESFLSFFACVCVSVCVRGKRLPFWGRHMFHTHTHTHTLREATTTQPIKARRTLETRDRGLE